MDIPSPDSAPAALADLIAAGLVSHEMIGDPSRLDGEAEALRTLCDLVSGSVWRIEPFHYAFRIGHGDLGGVCDGAGVDAQASALEGALQAALGADAAWVNAADLVPTALRAPYVALGGSSAAASGPLPDAPLLLLRAGDEARRAALEVAGPNTQAVIGARFALAAARLAAGLGEEGRLAERLAAIETGQAAILAALEAEAARAGHERSEQGVALDRLAGAIAALAARIDTAASRSDAMAETLVETMIETAARMAAQADQAVQMSARTAEETAARLAELATFRETIGLTLAEFLADLERRSAVPMPVRVPQFS